MYSFNSLYSWKKYACKFSSNNEVDEELLELFSIIFNKVLVTKEVKRYMPIASNIL